jgi:hypothetical protein
MALKPTRSPLFDSVRYFINSTGEAGVIVFAQTGAPGAGQSLDSVNSVVQVVNANPSGRVAVGLLLESVVNIDLSKQTLAREAEQVQVNSKVQLGIKGEWSTNRLGAAAQFGTGIVYPTTLYAGPSGTFWTSAGYAGSGWPLVGKAISAADSDGYAVIRIEL